MDYFPDDFKRIRAFINDFKNAVDAYENTNVDTRIVDLVFPGKVINVGDEFKFKVQVTNQGQLDMKNVRVRVIGTAYADVATLRGQWGNEALSLKFSLDANNSSTDESPTIYKTEEFRGLAKKTTGGVKVIVKAKIDSWDASLDHILIDHSAEGKEEGELKVDVIPSK